MTLLEQHSYFVQRRSRASGYRALAAAEYGRPAVWAHSPLFFRAGRLRAGRHLYRSWTVHRCWCTTSTDYSFSFLILGPFLTKKKNVTIREIGAWQNITIHDMPFLTKIADVSRFMSRFVIFSNCKKSNISNPTVFAGGANSRRWGRAGPGRRRLAQPAPGPAGDIFI